MEERREVPFSILKTEVERKRVRLRDLAKNLLGGLRRVGPGRDQWVGVRVGVVLSELPSLLHSQMIMLSFKLYLFFFENGTKLKRYRGYSER